MLTLGVAVATAIPLLALYAIYRLDLYATRSFRYVLVCVAWGIIATRVALLANTAVLDSGMLDRATITRVIAPAVEEVAKALIILYLIYRPHFTYFVDGAIYGFAVGIGFAVVENYHYLWMHQESAATLAGGRVLSTNLMHASTTAVTGIALALAHFQRTRRRGALIGTTGLAAAILMHMAFNTSVTRFSGSAAALYALAAAFGLAGAIGVALAIRHGLSQERAWIGDTLGASNRVAPGETEAVRHLDHAEAILHPIAERFGQHKADDVHALLQLEARLGIVRQTSDQLSEGHQKREAEAEIAHLYREMDARRRSIGVYCMLHLRAIAPGAVGSARVGSPTSGDSASGSIWESLGAAGGAGTGFDLWREMGVRMVTAQGRRRRVASPTFRRRLVVAAFAGLSAALWLAPHVIDWPGWDDRPERLVVQVALQWLLALGLFPALDAAGRDVLHSVDRRLTELARRARLRRRLLTKADRLLLFAGLLALSAPIWTSHIWSSAVSLPLALDRQPTQVAAQLLVVLTAVAVAGRLTFKLWLAAALGIGAVLLVA